MRNRDELRGDAKKPEEQVRKKVRHSPALILAPAKLTLLMNLVNLLPSSYRKAQPRPTTDLKSEPSIYFWRIRDFWFNNGDDENSLSSMYHLQCLTDELPIGLQAFVLNDDHGRLNQHEGYPTLVPSFDFYHYQPLTNISLLNQSENNLTDVVTKAKERIEMEVKNAESRIESRTNQASQKGSLKPAAVRDVFGYGFSEYQIGDGKFREVSLNILADRARQRFFFIVAAEEILDALVGPDTQKKLDRAWYIEMSGATHSFPYVEGDELKMYPPVLFLFVMGIQVSRIRLCGICDNYFWAARKDKKVCSVRCSATSRKRQERQRYFERKIGVRRRKGKRRKEK